MKIGDNAPILLINYAQEKQGNQKNLYFSRRFWLNFLNLVIDNDQDEKLTAFKYSKSTRSNWVNFITKRNNNRYSGFAHKNARKTRHCSKASFN